VYGVGVRAKQTDFQNEGCGVELGRKCYNNLPPGRCSGQRHRRRGHVWFVRIFAPVTTLLLYALLGRVSRKSGLLDDRRQGRGSVISEFGEAELQ
jgi:hypothetical protein